VGELLNFIVNDETDMSLLRSLSSPKPQPNSLIEAHSLSQRERAGVRVIDIWERVVERVIDIWERAGVRVIDIWERVGVILWAMQ